MITYSVQKHNQEQRKFLPKEVGRCLTPSSRRQGHHACSCFPLPRPGCLRDCSGHYSDGHAWIWNQLFQHLCLISDSLVKSMTNSTWFICSSDGYFGISLEMLCLGIKYWFLCPCFLKKWLESKKKDCFAEVSFPIRHTALPLAFPKESCEKSTSRVHRPGSSSLTNQKQSFESVQTIPTPLASYTQKDCLLV